jgi:hypothetical protein
MKRIYHPYWKWEDFKSGLYDLEVEYTEAEQTYLGIKVREILTNDEEFYSIALKVITEWIYEAEQNLTNSSRNKQAWIGQASCCYKLQVPERITKYGWYLMSVSEQKKANLVADRIIILWKKNHAKKIHKQECLASY